MLNDVELLSVLPLVLTCLCCAGEDLCLCVPNKIYSSQAYPDTAVCLRASTLGARRVAMPPLHKRLRCCDSALAAAQGKLYLLGGSCHLEVGGAGRSVGWFLCLVLGSYWVNPSLACWLGWGLYASTWG
jgi:hypothetical protein